MKKFNFLAVLLVLSLVFFTSCEVDELNSQTVEQSIEKDKVEVPGDGTDTTTDDDEDEGI